MDDPRSRCRNLGRKKEAKVCEWRSDRQLSAPMYEHSHLEREAPEQGNRPRAAFHTFGADPSIRILTGV